MAKTLKSVWASVIAVVMAEVMTLESEKKGLAMSADIQVGTSKAKVEAFVASLWRALHDDAYDAEELPPCLAIDKEAGQVAIPWAEFKTSLGDDLAKHNLAIRSRWGGKRMFDILVRLDGPLASVKAPKPGYSDTLTSIGIKS